MTCDTWLVTCDTWHVTRDMWRVTRDKWHVSRLGGWFLSKFQLPSSYCLWFMILWRSGGKGWVTEWINEWINDKAVYRTAPATPVLLKTLFLGVFPRASTRKLLKATSYMLPHIPSWVLIRTVYPFYEYLETRWCRPLWLRTLQRLAQPPLKK